MGVKGPMCQTRFFHDVGDAGTVVTTAAYRTRSSTDDALVGGFFGGASGLGVILSHDAYHIKVYSIVQLAIYALTRNACGRPEAGHICEFSAATVGSMSDCTPKRQKR